MLDLVHVFVPHGSSDGKILDDVITEAMLGFSYEVVDAAGAVDPAKMVSLISSNGADACGLANPTTDLTRVRFKIVKVTANAGGNITLTPETLHDGTQYVLTATDDVVFLAWVLDQWYGIYSNIAAS